MSKRSRTRMQLGAEPEKDGQQKKQMGHAVLYKTEKYIEDMITKKEEHYQKVQFHVKKNQTK